ncbi:hypothetical protein BHQ18_13700 [Mycolicibacterium flavescens]|uniref:Uncharacterized protein n=2 Tax=Mycolicibacterium flavescens TaxID=1776 RepID=A0A1E3RHZ3_MYCFV|nr:hypothetical protein BHQ18_13700 [Mycolicibacterium flavescens]
MGAALLSFSLMGPHSAIAVAEENPPSAADAQDGASPGTESPERDAPDSDSGETPGPSQSPPVTVGNSRGEVDDDEESTGLADDGDDENDDEDDAVDGADDTVVDRLAPDDESATADPLASHEDSPSDPPNDDPPNDDPPNDDLVNDTAHRVTPTNLVQPGESTPATTTAAATTPAITAPRAQPRTWTALVSLAIDNWTNASLRWIESLPVDNTTKATLEGALWTLRRTFLNRAPSVAPVQISGQIAGPIDGTVAAVDPEGDRIFFVMTRGPREGTVKLNGDGSYTYTPGETFDGVDTFSVMAVDVGLHMNLLDPFRSIGTNARSVINQGAIKFAFNFTTGAEIWTEERRAALRRSADELLLYLVVQAPVVLTYNVSGRAEDTSVLASAGSPLISEEPGFWRTVVQHKLLTGSDANGAAADGSIDWNFWEAWGLGDADEITADEYDFVSTAMHEFLHSFGFLTYLERPGENEDWTAWPIFDSFIGTADGVRPIGADYLWNTDYDAILVGGDGGMFFGGRHATAAYGGLVPLYTPNPWQNGSSGSHLNDVVFAGGDQKLMNAATGTGPGVRVLSAFEVGILRDLGYHAVVPQSPAYSAALLGFLLLRRRRGTLKSAKR